LLRHRLYKRAHGAASVRKVDRKKDMVKPGHT
jgi:hypothetical protein